MEGRNGNLQSGGPFRRRCKRREGQIACGSRRANPELQQGTSHQRHRSRSRSADARLGTNNQANAATRALRLREFIDRGSALGLFALRPVWLMTPDVASRVLQPKPGIFDTVIFDEASQMPVEYALPSLFRSKIVVVSGDEKQMPPTSFFASKVENDEAAIFDGEEPEDAATEEERDVFTETWNRREIKDCPDLLQLARSALRVKNPSGPLPVQVSRAHLLLECILLRKPTERTRSPSRRNHPQGATHRGDPVGRNIQEPDKSEGSRRRRRIPERSLGRSHRRLRSASSLSTANRRM